jgi:hypothetical protein
MFDRYEILTLFKNNPLKLCGQTLLHVKQHYLFLGSH